MVWKFGWTFCTYEQLYEDPERESSRILDCLGIRKTYFNSRAIRKISRVTRSNSALKSGSSPVTEWQRQLSKDQIIQILDVVQAFGIQLYDSDCLPNKKMLQDLGADLPAVNENRQG
jgi:hypothetical protein